MNSTDTLTALTRRLDEAAPRLTMLDRYYAGRQPLAFLAPEAREALGNRFGTLNSNLCRLAVTSLAERLRVTGFGVHGDDGDDRVNSILWNEWIHADLDELAGVAHREALTLGRAFIIVWADEHGNPTVTIESAHQVAVQRDPVTREVVAAVKRWQVGDTAYAVLYGADEITTFTAKSHGDPAAIPSHGWTAVETIPNPIGVVPVVPLVNADRLLDDAGVSELDDLAPLVDGLNKSLADLVVASEYFARPRRWATGVEPVEDENGNVVNPFPDGHRMMLSESPDTKFGQLPAADLGSYESGVRVLLGQIMAVSALPAHYIGVLTNTPSSADALRAAEASLAARAEARQRTFGRAWEQVARLILAITFERAVDDFEVTVKWADPATRSVAQEADAVVKLHAAGILPTTTALARLGYTAAEIEQINQHRRTDALATAGLTIGGQ